MMKRMKWMMVATLGTGMLFQLGGCDPISVVLDAIIGVTALAVLNNNL